MSETLEPNIESANEALVRISKHPAAVYSIPLIPFHFNVPNKEIFMKLENLQPIGSFKLRAAINVLESMMEQDKTIRHLVTCSAGNFGQAVAYMGSKLNIKVTIISPNHAPITKIEGMRRYGAEVILVSFDVWWKALEQRKWPIDDEQDREIDPESGKRDYTFVHPCVDPLVLAGNGTIGLEIYESNNEIDTVIVPYGGGALSCGVASVIKKLNPKIKVYAAEVSTAAPLSVALSSGKVTEIPYIASFVDGIGSKSVLKEVFPLAQKVLDGSLVVELAEVERAIKLCAERNRIIVEGAAGAAIAAAMSDQCKGHKIACVMSGGGLDSHILIDILSKEL